MKALVIAEKPSVAADIARALGGFDKTDDVYERDDMIVSSAVGHLLEIIAPEGVEVKRGKWSFAHLPVIPDHFDLQPLPKSEQKLKTLARLIKRKDVDRLINACDAGREGELIFRYIAQYTKAKQPIQRLWLQSMTPTAIRDAFQNLRSGEELQPLADAARCRSEADWLVGINGTRAMTAFNSKEGGFFKTSVGRVQTPTLAIVVEREETIRRFVSRPYFEVTASFTVAAGAYEGKWFDPQFKKDDADLERRAERLWDRAQAEDIQRAVEGGIAVVTEETKPSSQGAPALFDLTSLQREANSKFGFSAKNTLGLAQALYEKHKVLTYPRTDSKALPEDTLDMVRDVMKELSSLGFAGTYAKTVLKEGWIKPNKRIFDNSRVSDHFAIIPTGQLPKSLSEPEQKLYELVVKRFLAAFFPAAEFLNTHRVSTVAGHAFKSDGKVMLKPGWLAVYGRTEAVVGSASDKDKVLVAVGAGETAKTQDASVQSLHTRPPARYSEATLLSAMESAGRMVEDDGLREAMAGRGLGTPATRAAIIEGLLADTYLLREGRELVPTAKATQLMTLLRGLSIDALSRPELTGDWEFKLRQIEEGRLQREEFMREIARMTDHVVSQVKNFSSDTVPGNYVTLKSPCPACGGVVKENYRRYACQSCEFSLTKTPAGRTFEPVEVEQLLTDRHFGPVDGFRSKLGRPFSSALRLSAENKLEFDFGQIDDGDAEAQLAELDGKTPLGECPKCSGPVFPLGANYVCRNSLGTEKSCDFRSGQIILQQPISEEQMRKLLAEGKTDLLPGFVSARTRRAFKAYLVKEPGGKIAFEFEARPATKKSIAATNGAAVAEGETSAKPAARTAAAKKPATAKPRKPASKKPAR